MPVSEHILDKLRKNDKKTTEVSFSGTPVGDEGAKDLANAIVNNTNLQILEIGNSDIGAKGATALANMLSKTNSLKTLYLRGNRIGDEGSKALAEALKRNNCLEHLYLGGNGIGIEGVTAFAEAFTKNSTLQTIYLRNNDVGDQGVQILSDALMKNFGLRVLNVANAKLTIEGCRIFLKLLDVNTTLQSIVFEHNGVEDEEIIKEFSKKLAYNSSPTVAASNAISRKILHHCEEYSAMEKIRQDKRPMTLEQLSEKYSLSRSEQYHWSGINNQGNAILCSAFLHRMIFSKYADDSANEILQTLRKLYDKFLTRTKEDLANPKTIKPNAEILQAAQNLVS